jgi:hypothetical protein
VVEATGRRSAGLPWGWRGVELGVGVTRAPANTDGAEEIGRWCRRRPWRGGYGAESGLGQRQSSSSSTARCGSASCSASKQQRGSTEEAALGHVAGAAAAKRNGMQRQAAATCRSTARGGMQQHEIKQALASSKAKRHSKQWQGKGSSTASSGNRGGATCSGWGHVTPMIYS